MRNRKRAGKPLVRFNCAAPWPARRSQMQSYFGHVSPARSRARPRIAPGFLSSRTADGGTLILDEVGELPARDPGEAVAPPLQEGEIQPVGLRAGSRKVNVRVVAATNRDPRRRRQGRHVPRRSLLSTRGRRARSLPPFARNARTTSRRSRSNLPRRYSERFRPSGRHRSSPAPDRCHSARSTGQGKRAPARETRFARLTALFDRWA